MSARAPTIGQKGSAEKDPARMEVDQQTTMPWALKARRQPGHGPQCEGRGLENSDNGEKPGLGPWLVPSLLHRPPLDY